MNWILLSPLPLPSDADTPKIWNVHQVLPLMFTTKDRQKLYRYDSAFREGCFLPVMTSDLARFSEGLACYL